MKEAPVLYRKITDKIYEKIDHRDFAKICSHVVLGTTKEENPLILKELKGFGLVEFNKKYIWKIFEDDK